MEITCPQCGFTKDIPDDKIPSRAQIATCPKCKHRFKFREIKELNEEGEEKKENAQNIWDNLKKLDDKDTESSSHETDKHSENQYIFEDVPWESLEKHGFFEGFFETIKRVCISPRQFFNSMRTKGGYTRPLIFYLLISELYAAFRIIWSMVGIGVVSKGEQMNFLNMGLHGFSSLLWLLLYPIFLTGLLFIAAAINHLCLLVVKDGSRGFKGTFKVLCYSSAPMIMSVFPLLGPIIGVIWSSICNFIGFKYVHKTSSLKVAIAMLLPIIVVFLFTLPMAIHTKGM